MGRLVMFVQKDTYGMIAPAFLYIPFLPSSRVVDDGHAVW